MLIIGYSRSFAPATNETVWDANDYFDLRANGVAPAAPAWTVAVAGRARTDSAAQYFMSASSGAHVRRNSGANSFRIRWQNTSGSVVARRDALGDVANGQLFSLLTSCSRTGMKAQVNSATHEETFADGGVDLHGPYMINATFSNGAGAADLAIRAVWIGAGYLDVATHYRSFFDGDGMPTAAMRNGSAIGGLAPQFAQSGNAAAWEAYPSGKSGSFDLADA
jgi:hypothetical protein